MRRYSWEPGDRGRSDATTWWCYISQSIPILKKVPSHTCHRMSSSSQCALREHGSPAQRSKFVTRDRSVTSCHFGSSPAPVLFLPPSSLCCAACVAMSGDESKEPKVRITHDLEVMCNKAGANRQDSREFIASQGILTPVQMALWAKDRKDVDDKIITLVKTACKNLNAGDEANIVAVWHWCMKDLHLKPDMHTAPTGDEQRPPPDFFNSPRLYHSKWTHR